ncbi:LysE family translocator [Kocuria rosea]|uniref:LysE family translocator n=1 Tax=Kocuria rosea TaxID=1275 RepID=UPI002B24906C|nr:LysE family translocator [Kocuria rosea]MEB2528357.1 LysE family translocator [Kocuria rosea]MEB2617858.1 LysE family translocator [Kocuria rosea]
MTVVDVSVLPGFVAVILLFLLPPGPDMAYMLAAGLEGGRRFALKAILGIGTGMSVYAAAVVIGVGTVAQSHPALLDAVKVSGAAYLLWLAYATIRNARCMASGPSDVSTGRPYLRGVLVSLTNPKVILFFLAVLPQFMGNAHNAGLQLAMLGAVNVLSEVLLYGTIGVLAGAFHARFKNSRKAGAMLNYLAGTVYVVLAGVVTAEVLARSISS